ncbi:MAG: PAS domain S-box protein [Myxococcales bacterium]|nr:PAS domain S-box protein [Myxococcales bacterium]
MNAPTDRTGEEPRGRSGLDRRLVILMGARLGLSLLSLGLVLALDAATGSVNVPARRGLYGTVAFAFLATVGYGLVLQRVRRTRAFAAINLATDFAIVTALVQFSGGTDSVFTFLYVLVAVYGAVLFELPGAAAASALGATSFGALLLAGYRGFVEPNPSGVAQPGSVLLALWLAHAGALVVATSLGRFLASDLRRTDEALDQKTSDLNELWSLHRRTVDSLMSGLLTTDTNGRITSFNPEAVRITALEAVEADGQFVESILPGVSAIVAETDDDLTGMRGRARLRYRNRGGAELFLGVGAYILRDAEAAPSGHVIIFQDVTDVVEMEEELRRSERLAALGELSASIAHEIRNPLAAISGSVQILQKKLGAVREEGENARLMEIAVRETDRLDQLIGDFLHYARPAPLRLEAVAVGDLVNEVLEMFDAARPEGVTTLTDVPPGLCVLADAAQLRQVVWNLVLNGAQAMPTGGLLRIVAAPSDAGEGRDPPTQERFAGRRREAGGKNRWVEISISDQGTGMAPDVLEHVFDPFFTTRSEGSGLGLPTVHRIVEGHGGSVRIESRLGEGTAIRLRLPSVEATA